jgi:ABC-type Fe3+/spermidine/putrescine transport system ATPase subunit
MGAGTRFAMSEASPAAIEVRGLSAGYGGPPVLHGVDLTVRPGEFVAVLGASGCGKTTLLRAIAGFQKAYAGEILLFGRDVADVPPEKRGLAMVFQSYALWPHMSVLGNIGYGLKLRGVRRDEIRRRVARILALLNMPGFEDRMVTDLSGGQRQRVALGRALAVEPKALLLDEPLSNLDAKVRLQLRGEIKALQRKLGFAAIHVTHDREEAMTMADRIIVMDQGRIAQTGRPEEVYDRPASPFIATFMGADNTMELEVTRNGGDVEIRVPGGAEPISWQGAAPHGRVTAYFRDDVARLDELDRGRAGEIVLPGRIASRAYPGGHYRYGVEVAGRQFSVKDTAYRDVGTPVGLFLPISALHLFPADGSTTRESKQP